jgi:hypothetical protein
MLAADNTKIFVLARDLGGPNLNWLAPQRVGNVFDQYTQSESRITHALVSALNKDRSLLRQCRKGLRLLNGGRSTTIRRP